MLWEDGCFSLGFCGREEGRSAVELLSEFNVNPLFSQRNSVCCSHKGIFLRSLFHTDPFEPQRRLPVKKSRQQLQREKALQEQSQKLGLQDGSSSVPPEQLLSAPKPSFNSPEAHSSLRVPPGPLTLTSPVGDGKPQGTESPPRELALENSHDSHKNTEVLPPKPDCRMEKKKVELLVSLYIRETFFHFTFFSSVSL